MKSSEVFEYYIGSPNLRKGRTSLRLTAEGTAVLDSERAGEALLRFNGNLDKTQVSTLLSQIDKAAVFQNKAQGSATGEGRAQLRLRRADGIPYAEATIEESQFNDGGELQKLKALLDEHVRRLSSNQVAC